MKDFGNNFRHMKLIGFIIEHDNIKKADPLNSVLGTISNDSNILFRIIDYLSKGTLVLSWMGYSMDAENGDLIAPDSYYTDGTFIWPVYFPYYLNKYDSYKLDEEFIKYLVDKDFQQKKLDSSMVENIEKELLKDLQDKNPPLDIVRFR